MRLLRLVAALSAAGALAQEPPRSASLLLVGDWPIERLAVYADAGLLDRELGERCGGTVQWRTAYGGVPGAVSFLFAGFKGHPAMPKPDYVLLAYGQLDVFIGPARTNAAAFEANLRKAVDILRAKYPAAKLVLGTAVPFASDAALGDAALDRDGGWNAVLEQNANRVTRAVAQELGLPLLDLYRAFVESGGDALIGFAARYPNARGRQVLARAVCEGMARVAVGGSAVAAPAAPAGFGGRRHVQLMLLGDSITATSLGMPTLSGRLEAALEAAGGTNTIWDVTNVAVGGESVPGALARIQGLLDRNQPQYMTVSYGLNDMYFTPAKQDPKVFEANLRKLLAIIREHPSKPQVFLLTCTPIHDEVVRTQAHRREWDAAFWPLGGPNQYLDTAINPVTRRLAPELGLPLIEVHGAFMAGDLGALIGKDGVHLTAAGGQLLAQTVQSGIARFLQARPSDP
jgi:lysophospholipase L1-like esterase